MYFYFFDCIPPLFPPKLPKLNPWSSHIHITNVGFGIDNRGKPLSQGSPANINYKLLINCNWLIIYNEYMYC